MLAEDELIKAIQGGESDCVEFTESADLDKIRKTVCAFANDLPHHNQSGLMFVGIKDDGSCADLAITDELLQKLGGLRSDGKINPFPTMEVGKKNLNGCNIAVIQVEPSDNPPVKVDGRCWIRTGPRRAQATAEEERRLTEKRRWGNVPYDMQGVSGASVEKDLDMLVFERVYLRASVSPEALEENDRDPTQQLQALRLTTQDGTPTITAILMLGKVPSYWFPGAYVQFVRFAGKEITGPISSQTAIHGTLSDQLLELDKILKVNITTSLDTKGETHIEQPDYPYEALRELSRNAIIHRNYENSYSPVRINWFVDRIEMVSPGSVFGEVTRENFGTGSTTAYRNPTIAEAMKNMGFMQRFGIGIATARNALQNNGNPPPEFAAEDTVALVTVKKRL